MSPGARSRSFARSSRGFSHRKAPFTGALVNNAPAAAFAGAFLGCLATLHLGAGDFVPCIASALATTLLCGPVLLTRTTGLFPGDFFAAIYGGSFAGMTPVLRLIDDAPGASVMPAGALFVLLSIVSGIAFCIVAEIDTRSGRRLAGGYGGRSGTIATVASFLFVEAALLFSADDRLFSSCPCRNVGCRPEVGGSHLRGMHDWHVCDLACVAATKRCVRGAGASGLYRRGDRTHWHDCPASQ